MCQDAAFLKKPYYGLSKPESEVKIWPDGLTRLSEGL